ncbi:unnamed protein product [Prunus armeniaca]
MARSVIARIKATTTHWSGPLPRDNIEPTLRCRPEPTSQSSSRSHRSSSWP